VMAPAGDPIGTGLVVSLARPGGNVTGVSGVAAELARKNVQLIREVMPSVRRVAALCNASDPFAKPFLEQIQLGARTVGVGVLVIMIGRSVELEAAFARMSNERIDAAIVQGSLPTTRAAQLALQHHLAAASIVRGFAENGGLFSYSDHFADTLRRATAYVD